MFKVQGSRFKVETIYKTDQIDQTDEIDQQSSILKAEGSKRKAQR